MEKIICWGAGKQAKRALESISSGLYEILFFVDSDEQKWTSSIDGLKIKSPDLVVSNIEQCDFLLITIERWEQIFAQCIRMNVCPNKIKCFDVEDLSIKTIDEISAKKIFSQDGEEVYLREKFRNYVGGVYVDVGAYNPFKFSNTYWAYNQGWRGINIEPDYDNYRLFCVFRPHDININCGISKTDGMMEFYQFKDSALNMFSMKEVQGSQKVTRVRVRTLRDILAEVKVWKIDFMDIDVEGMEMDVLESIDWEKVEINCILLEQRNMTLLDVVKSEECIYLKEKGYEPTNKYGRTVFYEKIHK